MKSTRLERLNSEFRKLIYDALKYDLVLSGLTEMFSITEVDTAPDLKTAKVYVSVYSTNEEKKKQTFETIKNASKQVRKILGAKMRIKYVPELDFREDSALEYGNKIDKILSQITYGENNDD